MLCRVYFRVEADEIELVNFNENLPDEKKGLLKARKKIIDGVVHSQPPSWQSSSGSQFEKVEGVDSCLMAIDKTVESYLAIFESAQQSAFKEICLEVVLKYESQDEVGGLFLHSDTISKLSSIGAGFDLDAYLDIDD